MTLSKRTKISLSQFLELLNLESVKTLFEKYDIEKIRYKENIKNAIIQADNDKIANLVKEVVGTQGLQNNLEQKLFFNNAFYGRWNDLEKCLMLDGYKIENDKLVKIEQNIDGVTAFEDELTNELKASNLFASKDIINHIENSANHFKQGKFNECLSNGRIALETLIRQIVVEKFNDRDMKFGEALSYLTNNNFLVSDKKEEELLAKVYGFISDGSHKPLHFSDEEYARYGRNLAMSMCYYVIKKYNYEN